MALRMLRLGHEMQMGALTAIPTAYYISDSDECLAEGASAACMHACRPPPTILPAGCEQAAAGSF